MALKIKNDRIIGTIDNLEDKLNGKLPVDRLELFYLINSYPRINNFTFTYNNETSDVLISNPRKNYNLSKLDTSQITDMSCLFKYSTFNGNISKWDVSNVTNMKDMFAYAIKFNKDISNWNTSNVTNMSCMFFDTKEFNQDISNWNISNVINIEGMLCYAIKFAQNIGKWDLSNIKEAIFMLDNTEAFENKYNDGNTLPSYINDIKEWFNNNRDKMREIEIKEKYSNEIENFFLQVNNNKNREL